MPGAALVSGDSPSSLPSRPLGRNSPAPAAGLLRYASTGCRPSILDPPSPILALALAETPRKANALKPRLADLLRCPTDGGALELAEWESSALPLHDAELVRIRRMGLRPERFEREVMTGLLVNRRLQLFYPVTGGVPRLLTFPTGVVRDFCRRYRSRLDLELPGFSAPSGSGAPGEEATLRTFSNDWPDFEWDERAYWGQSPEDFFRTMRFALDLDHKELKDRLVCEAGIGVGGIADYVSRSTECELVGIGLSHAVDQAFRHFSANPFLHIVQASAFAPPLEPASFDYVYSQGVIHRTYSTQAALRSISRLPKPGANLYVWVYSPADEQRTALRRVLYAIEGVLRPVYSRLPDRLQAVALAPWAPLYIAHQKFAARSNPHFTTYSWREAMQAARDRWTPRYVHRHSTEQVERWFEANGYESLTSINDRPRPDYVPEALAACTGVEGTRRE